MLPGTLYRMMVQLGVQGGWNRIIWTASKYRDIHGVMRVGKGVGVVVVA